MFSSKDQTKRLAIARFTTELIELRIGSLFGERVEYSIQGGERVGRREFELWCARASSAIRLDASPLESGRIAISCSYMPPDTISRRTWEIRGFREAFHRDVESRGHSKVRFLIDGGKFSIGATEFFEWLDTYELGALGWVGGHWSLQGASDERQWIFIITRKVAHLFGKGLERRRPTAIARWTMRLLGPLIARWLFRRTGMRPPTGSP